ncbi:MAG: heterodisulfide reductase-related iron-sulfur binding cluster [Gemmatimonadota bacterium]|nr:heterodisulfide reductase-related iron-sulfur binding cluster [Gemmatimonadota bacterium]
MTSADARPAATGWSDDLLACVHCGFCLPACPTYEVLLDENDSPRGRLALMRAHEEGRIGSEGAFQLHIGRCLGCRACETACPAGVPYGSLLERARERAPAPRRHRTGLLLRALTGRRAGAVLYALGRVVRATGVAGFLARRLPGRAGLGAGMLAATRPFAGLARATGLGAAITERGAEAPARVPERAFVLLEGCVMRGLFAHVHEAGRSSLRRRGWRERPAPGQACCGALHAHAGRLEEARAMARRNIAAFEQAADATIVADAAGCGAALRDYPDWLRNDPTWCDRARALAGRVRDVSELLAEPATWGREPAAGDPGERSEPRPVAPGSRTEPPRRQRVAYDAPCHLLHAQGVRDAPLAALAAAGVDAAPLPSWERCCGGAGLYNLLEPRLAAEVAAPKLREIEAAGVDVVATGNPGCQMFLGAALVRAGRDVRVAHPAELVDAAERAGERAADVVAENGPEEGGRR